MEESAAMRESVKIAQDPDNVREWRGRGNLHIIVDALQNSVTLQVRDAEVVDVVDDRIDIRADHSRAENAPRNDVLGERLCGNVVDEIERDEGEDATSGRVRPLRKMDVEIIVIKEKKHVHVSTRAMDFLNAIDLSAARIRPQELTLGTVKLVLVVYQSTCVPRGDAERLAFVREEDPSVKPTPTRDRLPESQLR